MASPVAASEMSAPELVADAEFARAVASMLEADFACASPVSADALAGKPYWFRLAARAARLTAPIQ